MKRSLEIITTGVQSFTQRFPGKRRRLDESVPQCAPWRCNLTGLSQRHNLYFVAYGAEIFVYRPQFPSQALSEPVLVIPCREEGPRLGYLDLRQPDCINNLLVAFLGKEEVVATVRDNGDVETVLIRHVLQAIQARAGKSLHNLADEVRPSFQGNVGISAWGLAIHSQARIIAVSSNNHRITIFKFALVASARRMDVIEQLINGEANIPSIAFCNTGDDPRARWLLTTDINGVCRAIDLHKSLPVQSFRFGRQIEGIYGGGYDRLNAGWSIMFLDQRSFCKAPTLHDAIGTLELPDARDNPTIWDLSKTVRGLLNHSNAFVHYQTTGKPQRESRHPPDSDEADVDLEIYEEVAVVDEELEEAHTDVPEMVDDFDEDDEGTEDTISATAFYGGERVCANFPRFQKSVPMCDDLPCPILHASVRNIYLLQPTQSAHWRPPFLGIAAPLKQSIEVQHHTLNMFDRLNMSVYIAALGVVVIASQKGRAIVLALTKLDGSAQYPAELASLGSKTNYTMRIDAVLPFDSQEKLNQRPFSPLHGIAASPLQGTEDLSDEKKRWRLLLMYQDQSVLSYEIARQAVVQDMVIV
ncbi:hypothetical protein AMS68_007346 [Peltaster fructicola]|uniref:Uncharacterized protein n=1 Tax=Peltaster fructicola TaxID=286661 RepID=A0A6H0Y4R1_9PEZI|nr:hypothetical protein AMS68_007346 [Peltaster fructicola]